MGAPTSDFSTTYTPHIDKSEKLSVESGIQSQDLGGIIEQIQKLFAGGMDNQQRELEALREENKNIRADMKDVKFKNDDSFLSDRRDRDGFTLRNRELDQSGESIDDNALARSRDQDLSELQTRLQFGSTDKLMNNDASARSRDQDLNELQTRLQFGHAEKMS